MMTLGNVARSLPRFDARGLRRRPLASLASTLCLALGLATCAVAWTLLGAAVLRPFGLPDAGRLVIVWETDPTRSQPLIEVSLPNFLDWQREAHSLESMAAFGSSHWPALARIGSETVPLAARGVSAAFFGTLGIRPVLGHDFPTDAAVASAAPPVVLSHRVWQSLFASDSPTSAGRPGVRLSYSRS